jgi:Leucine-rich repeat (LRR) protein
LKTDKEEQSLANEKSPIFLQFIETLWQLMLQFPRHFEFNERFLVYILDEMYSCQFGTFMCNNDRDRELLKAVSPSIWHAVNTAPEDFINPFYRETSRELILEPATDINSYKVWNDYYLRYNQRVKRQLKKMNYHMANNGISNPQLEFAGAELFSLPIEVLRYNALQELNMARNQLNRLPYHLIYMTTIRSLILSHNPIFHIHEEYMAMLAQSLIGLQELNLNFTKLKTLPKAITKFPSLRILRVRNNNIMELPMSIERLVNLEVLDARNNKINALPKGFSKLKSLRVLGLGKNALSVLPDDFFQMGSLEVLDLSENELSQVPDKISELSGLVKLFMDVNRIEYFSPNIGDLSKLEVLSMEKCFLAELPVGVSKLHGLKYVHAMSFEFIPNDQSLQEIESE